MFDALPESLPRRRRRRGGIVGSIAAHGIVLGTLVQATSHRPVRASIIDPGPSVIYVAPPPVAEAPTSPSGAGGAISPLPPINVPPIDLTRVGEAVPQSPILRAPLPCVACDWPSSPTSRAIRADRSGPQPFSALDVDRAAEARPGAPSPRYPATLEAAGIEGAVRVQFVVDTTGRVDVHGIRVIAADDSAFAAAVRAAIAHTRYQPAELGGRAVNQLVEQTFTFRITGR